MPLPDEPKRDPETLRQLDVLSATMREANPEYKVLLTWNSCVDPLCAGRYLPGP